MIDATDETNQNRLHTGEIVADAVGFMFAGHETTSITLVFATYVLGAYPEVQEKLANEIHDYFEDNPVRDSLYYYVTSDSSLKNSWTAYGPGNSNRLEIVVID